MHASSCKSTTSEGAVVSCCAYTQFKRACTKCACAYARIHMQMYAQVLARTCTHVHTHTQTYTYTHARTHTHTHTHTFTHELTHTRLGKHSRVALEDVRALTHLHIHSSEQMPARHARPNKRRRVPNCREAQSPIRPLLALICLTLPLQWCQGIPAGLCK